MPLTISVKLADGTAVTHEVHDPHDVEVIGDELHISTTTGHVGYAKGQWTDASGQYDYDRDARLNEETTDA
jgi:hypothetical protein